MLVSCNVMEAAGTGFDKIVEDYKDADDKHRPFISSASDHFTLVLPDLTYVDGIEESAIPTIDLHQFQKAQDFDEKVLGILLLSRTQGFRDSSLSRCERFFVSAKKGSGKSGAKWISGEK